MKMDKNQTDDILAKAGFVNEKGEVYKKPKLEEILSLEAIVKASCHSTHDVC